MSRSVEVGANALLSLGGGVGIACNPYIEMFLADEPLALRLTIQTIAFLGTSIGLYRVLDTADKKVWPGLTS
jgi:hypothetical protein